MGPRVLVAEDDRAIRESLTLALELEGHDVEAVTDGGHALEAIMAHEPDLIVLDWMMPGVDGLSVCRRVRSGGSAVPILMLTARTEIADRVSGLDAGADDYLAKPFSLDELLAGCAPSSGGPAATPATAAFAWPTSSSIRQRGELGEGNVSSGSRGRSSTCSSP